uniref:FHA domain-containing protein n=2 Tax=Brassica campestris TaxID=3711 RepID=M4EF38_BRACM
MEIEGEDGTKLILKPGDKSVFGRGSGFTTDDLTVSRRHVSLELKPFAGETDSDRVSLEVLGRNPVWVRKREPGEKIQTFRKSETGEIKAGDRFCVSGQLPIWFTLKSRDERVSDGESGLDCIDGDPVKEFGFLVIGKEFDQYPKSRVRDVKQWEWFLEDSSKRNSDDEDDDGGKKGRKGLSKKRRRRGKKGNEEDDDWSAESEEDKELMVKSKRVVSPIYSTRSKKTKKDVNASSSISSSRAPAKQRGRVDMEEDEDDETLGGFIVSDEEAEFEEEDEPNTDDEEELVEDDEDEDED